MAIGVRVRQGMWVIGGYDVEIDRANDRYIVRRYDGLWYIDGHYTLDQVQHIILMGELDGHMATPVKQKKPIELRAIETAELPFIQYYFEQIPMLTQIEITATIRSYLASVYRTDVSLKEICRFLEIPYHTRFVDLEILTLMPVAVWRVALALPGSVFMQAMPRNITAGMWFARMSTALDHRLVSETQKRWVAYNCMSIAEPTHVAMVYNALNRRENTVVPASLKYETLLEEHRRWQQEQDRIKREKEALEAAKNKAWANTRKDLGINGEEYTFWVANSKKDFERAGQDLHNCLAGYTTENNVLLCYSNAKQKVVGAQQLMISTQRALVSDNGHTISYIAIAATGYGDFKEDRARSHVAEAVRLLNIKAYNKALAEVMGTGRNTRVAATIGPVGKATKAMTATQLAVLQQIERDRLLRQQQEADYRNNQVLANTLHQEAVSDFRHIYADAESWTGEIKIHPALVAIGKKFGWIK